MIDDTHENLLANYDWSFPVPIAYGPGRLREMGEHATNFELTKPLIVTDQGSAELPFIDTLQQALLFVWGGVRVVPAGGAGTHSSWNSFLVIFPATSAPAVAAGEGLAATRLR